MIQRLLRRLLRSLRTPRTEHRLLLGCVMIWIIALAYGISTAHHAPAATPPTTHTLASSQHVVKKKSVPAAPPVPTPSPPSTAAAPAVTPAPKPAADVTRSPAAVASTNTSPGSGVSGLAPTAGSLPPAAPATSAETTNTPTTPMVTCTNTPGRYYSANWSGYFRTGCTFTAVAGAWTVPTPTTTSTTDTTTDSTWIGIGGVDTNDLIQVGTEATVDTDGTINAAVFYELLPDAPHYPVTITVAPGDRMSATLQETSANLWLISITDATTGQTYTRNVSYTSSHSSVEWVEEDPSFADGSLVPFDNFGTVTFTGSTSTGNGVTSTLADGSSITLVDDQGRALAVPGAVTGASNDSFSVTRRNI